MEVVSNITRPLKRFGIDMHVVGVHHKLVKGKRVGILTDGGSEPLLVFLAADCIGVSAVPLCIKSPDEVLAHSIDHSGVEMLVVDRRGYERFGQLHARLQHAQQLVLTEGEAADALSWDDLVQSGGELPEVAIDPADESKILYTSGSSGLPKGVIQTHANIVANVEEVWDALSQREPFRTPPPQAAAVSCHQSPARGVHPPPGTHSMRLHWAQLATRRPPRQRFR